MKRFLAGIAARRWLVVVLQVVFLAALLGFLAWAVRDTWRDALPRLRDADPVELVIACLILTVYYLMFVVGWQWILRALGINTSYSVALQSEMASMLAKYIPGGIWTPAARVLWLRKAGGVDKTSVVVASILLEAGLSAVAGCSFSSCAAVRPGLGRADLAGRALRGGGRRVLHPRVFRRVAGLAFRPFGAAEPPSLPWRTMLGLLAYYRPAGSSAGSRCSS